MHIKQYQSKEQQAAELAQVVAAQLKEAITANTHASLAVPGGTTPAPFLRVLARAPLAWSSVSVTLTDERQVPLSHDASNQKQLRECLDVFTSGAQFIALYDDAKADSGLKQAQENLATALPLDVCVMGMGEDGHIASLFPNMDDRDAALAESNKEIIIPVVTPSSEHARVSFTLAELLRARHIYLLITGHAKYTRVQDALDAIANNQWENALPVQYLLAKAADKVTVHYTE